MKIVRCGELAVEKTGGRRNKWRRAVVVRGRVYWTTRGDSFAGRKIKLEFDYQTGVVWLPPRLSSGPSTIGRRSSISLFAIDVAPTLLSKGTSSFFFSFFLFLHSLCFVSCVRQAFGMAFLMVVNHFAIPCAEQSFDVAFCIIHF